MGTITPIAILIAMHARMTLGVNPTDSPARTAS